jgi:hypothetical protein
VRVAPLTALGPPGLHARLTLIALSLFRRYQTPFRLREAQKKSPASSVEGKGGAFLRQGDGPLGASCSARPCRIVVKGVRTRGIRGAQIPFQPFRVLLATRPMDRKSGPRACVVFSNTQLKIGSSRSSTAMKKEPQAIYARGVGRCLNMQAARLDGVVSLQISRPWRPIYRPFVFCVQIDLDQCCFPIHEHLVKFRDGLRRAHWSEQRLDRRSI